MNWNETFLLGPGQTCPTSYVNGIDDNDGFCASALRKPLPTASRKAAIGAAAAKVHLSALQTMLIGAANLRNPPFLRKNTVPRVPKVSP